VERRVAMETLDGIRADDEAACIGNLYSAKLSGIGDTLLYSNAGKCISVIYPGSPVI